MKPVAGVCAILFLAIGVSAQTATRSFGGVFSGGASAAPGVTRSFGSVVFPGGTSATTPGITRNFGSVVFPGGSPFVPVVRTAGVIGVPHGVGVRPAASARGQNFRRGLGNNGNTQANSFVYAYPLFVGGYDNSFVGSDPTGGPPAMMPPPAQPAPVMAYPAETARPVMIQVAPGHQQDQSLSAYQAPPEERAASSERFLLAFKDHTVYSAVAYWFDGDTLHYFTSGSVHNQVSVSLIDRDLTTRLNKELGIDFHMLAPK